MPEPTKPRILIVDDRAEKLLVYQTVLEHLNAEIITARSGAEALKQVLDHEFAVILLDVNMPEIDGLETATLIRHHSRGRRTPIIFITAYADEMQTALGYRLGAVDYILSPVIPDILRTKVAVFVDLYQAQADLAQSKEELEQRVAERTNELHASNEREKYLRAEAERLSRLKDEFLATLSHELRTPLNAIYGWITLLRTGRLDPQTEERALETIERNARAQKRLIEDLLDVSRAITGKIVLELSAFEPRRVIEAALESMQPSAQAKDIRLVPLLETVPGVVRGDFARLQQVICNMLSNAIKFTPPGGQVDVMLAQRGGEAVISIKDTGQGIKPEFLPHVFDRFRQEDGSISRRHGGLGIGLAIVHHLVELHGGSVECSSEGEGRGSTFTLRLALREPEIAASGLPPAEPTRPPKLAGLRVLVVDDDSSARELLSRLLQAYGAEVILADTGQTALMQLFEQRPDVLLADLGMPEMDGISLIEQVRALDPHLGGDTPAVAVTACATAQDRLRALQAGFQNHVAKPFEPEELAAVIWSVARGGPSRELTMHAGAVRG